MTVLAAPVVDPVVFIAVALNLYVVPLVSPVITQLSGVAVARTVHVLPTIAVVPVLSKACTVNDVGGPTVVPLAATGVTVAVAVVLPAVAAETVGAPGTAGVHNANKVTSEK